MSNSGAKGAYAPDGIQPSIFLPLIKKALMGGIVGRHQKYFLFSYNKILCHPPSPPLLEQHFFMGIGHDFASYENISSPKKIESAPDEIDPGHASL